MLPANKASGSDGIPVELLQILKDDAVKVLHSICQQIWKTQQWPQDWKRSVCIPIPKKDERLDVAALPHRSASNPAIRAAFATTQGPPKRCRPLTTTLVRTAAGADILQP